MKNIRTLAGMAVFALGVLATSSCSKDEFFGLEESEVIDASTKTEIAMSQEYVDFVLACSEMADFMSQPMDTTTAEVKIGPDGKRILYKEGPQLSAMALFEVLKEKYPELEKADKMDLDEIMEIALSKNKALKRNVATKTTEGFPDSWHWALSLNKPTNGFLWDGWEISCYPSEIIALQHVLLCASEEEYTFLGGLNFADHSATAMWSMPGWPWPSIANHGYPVAESDYVVSYEGLSIYDFMAALGEEYTNGHKLHYVFTFEGTGEPGSSQFGNPSWYHVSSYYIP